LSYNFGSRYARKPVKSSKDADFNLVSKTNLKQKKPVGLEPRARKTPPKIRKTPPLVTTPTEKPIPKTEKKL